MQSFCRNRKICSAFGYRFRHLSWRALMHVQGNSWITLSKTFNHLWQSIAGLGMGSGNIQRAHFWMRMLGSNRLDAFDAR
ncbi:Uncharacterised protein [Vibrio cholerae]|nr:Uncharacterised protein [Vibrio cholerae]CSA77026.1 Uncharacterised protein [Vibrio cholerae]